MHWKILHCTSVAGLHGKENRHCDCLFVKAAMWIKVSKTWAETEVRCALSVSRNYIYYVGTEDFLLVFQQENVDGTTNRSANGRKLAEFGVLHQRWYIEGRFLCSEPHKLQYSSWYIQGDINENRHGVGGLKQCRWYRLASKASKALMYSSLQDILNATYDTRHFLNNICL